jgi:hypothetical protein
MKVIGLENNLMECDVDKLYKFIKDNGGVAWHRPLEKCSLKKSRFDFPTQ